MQFRVNLGRNGGNLCNFFIGNRPAAQFDSRLIEQLYTQGKDIRGELKGMLLQAVGQSGLQMTPEHDADLTKVVNDYVDIMENCLKEQTAG